MRTIKQNEVSFDNATLVISNASKFILPVPNFGDGGEALVFPEGHEKASQLILDYKGRPIGTNGVVFFNPTDKVVQAAPGDGNSIIIVNRITPEQANEITSKVLEFGQDPSTLKLTDFKAILQWLYESGMKDFYTSNKGFYQKSLTRVGSAPRDHTGTEIPFFGLHKRDDQDVCKALLAKGPVTVESTSAGVAEATRFEGNGVILSQGTSFRAIQLDAFLATYRKVDGSTLTEQDLPVFE
jgi:hypothetical protein